MLGCRDKSHYAKWQKAKVLRAAMGVVHYVGYSAATVFLLPNMTYSKRSKFTCAVSSMGATVKSPLMSIASLIRLYIR